MTSFAWQIAAIYDADAHRHTLNEHVPASVASVQGMVGGAREECPSMFIFTTSALNRLYSIKPGRA